MAFLDETGLAELWSLTKDCVNWYVWEKSTEQYVENHGTTKTFSMSWSSVQNWTYSTTISISESGVVSMVNPALCGSAWSNKTDAAAGLIGKYLMISGDANIYYVDSATVNDSGNVSGTSYLVTAVMSKTVVGYVSSPDPNAYPINDGYTYLPMGQLGEKTRIATGSYRGTGTYSSSDSRSLTFDFEPKLLVIVGKIGGKYHMLAVNGVTHARTDPASSSSNADTKVTWSGNTVTWLNTSNVDWNLNASGAVYCYLAIG